MTETFKPIPGYEGYYEVSPQGTVCSVTREIVCSNGATKVYSRKTLKLSNTLEYPRVFLMKNGVRRTCYVHSLVLLTYVGNPPDGYECRHLDGNPTNNQLDNLCWGTSSENGADRTLHGTASKKLTIPIVKLIKDLFNRGFSNYELAHIFNVARCTINRIRLGHIWKNI